MFKFVDVDVLSAAMVRAAQKSSVPIALHLDHGHTYEGGDESHSLGIYFRDV